MKRFSVAIFVDTKSGFGRRILNGISSFSRTNEPWIMYGDPDRVVAPIESLAKWNGDGVIAQAWNPELREALNHSPCPVVNVSQHMPGSVFPSVQLDSGRIGQLVAEHLISRGFEHFGYCGFQSHYYSELRRDAFVAELEAAGHTCSCIEPDAPQDNASRWDAYQLQLTNWVRSLPKPVGVMCCNDARARHIAQACMDSGVRVPEELALVGVDNDELFCEMSNPPLSSVDVAAEQVGYEAAALLQKMMNGAKPVAQVIYMQPKGIVTRRSSDILAIADPLLATAVRYIHDHAIGQLSVEDVVAAVPLSRRVLERRFKSDLKRTINDEILHVKINHAKQLLIHSDLPNFTVAERCGFNYVQQFNVMFKRRTGQTPTVYRNQYRMRNVDPSTQNFHAR